MKYGLLTDRGIVRKKNEDYVDNFKVSENGHLFVLADGMGGHTKGDVASETAVTTVIEYFKKHIAVIEKLYKAEDVDKVKEFFKRAIANANEKVYQLSQREEKGSMGTTLVMTYVMQDKALIANVGDSRVYLHRQEELSQLTTDHSYVQELVKMGVITREEAKSHERKNLVTRAIGSSAEIQVDFYDLDLQKRDVLLMCSDGLSNLVDEKEIEEVLSARYLPLFSCEKLIAVAKQRGGYDNISSILIYY